jgi:hypothetical protein
MGKEDWQSLYDSLEVNIAEGRPKAIKPTPEVLKNYTITTGFKLPTDYCDFIQVFGPGELGEKFSIYAPGYPTFGDSIDLATFNHSLHTDSDSNDLDFYQKREQIERLHFFACTSASEVIGWDPEDTRDVARADYGIYIMLHGRRSPELLTPTFREFVLDVCLGNGYFKFFTEETHWDSSVRGNQRVFRPWIDSDC